MRNNIAYFEKSISSLVTICKKLDVEWAIMIWSFAWVSLLMLLFSRFFPLVPLFEQKESQVFTDDIQIGRAKVPAIVREVE